MLKRGPRNQEPTDRSNKRGKRRPEPLVPAKGRRQKVAEEPVKRRSRAARHPIILLANMVFFLIVAGVAIGVAGLVIGQPDQGTLLYRHVILDKPG